MQDRSTKQIQRAVWSIKDKLSYVDLPIPQPEAGEVLIQNVCCAMNPKDWKFPRWIDGWEAVEGNDVAGFVEAVGAGVDDFAPGDRVGALTKTKTHHKYGCYQEYSIAPASTTFHLDKKTSFEDASTLPLAFTTAVLALYQQFELPLNSEKAEKQQTVIINGASSCVGAYAIQLALRSGYRVVGIAGAGADFVRSLGCTNVVEYRKRTDKEISAEVHKLAPDAKYALDCVSVGSSVGMLSKALGQEGTICTLLPTAYDKGATVRNSIGKVQANDSRAEELPSDIVLKRALIFDAHGPAEELASVMLRQASKWIAEGSFKTMPVQLMSKGLYSVPEGLKLLEEKKVSAAKLVYRIADTPVESDA